MHTPKGVNPLCENQLCSRLGGKSHYKLNTTYDQGILSYVGKAPEKKLMGNRKSSYPHWTNGGMQRKTQCGVSLGLLFTLARVTKKWTVQAWPDTSAPMDEHAHHKVMESSVDLALLRD